MKDQFKQDVLKAEADIDFDLEHLNSLQFKDPNGLGTSYTIWHKPE